MTFPLEVALKTAIARLATFYPETPLLSLSKEALWDFVNILEEEQKKATIIRAGEEQVRVMRLYVFEGPRKAIEQQLLRSLPDGTKDDWRQGSVKIHVATIGTFPEVLQPKQPQPAAPVDPSPTGPGMMPFPKDRASDR